MTPSTRLRFPSPAGIRRPFSSRHRGAFSLVELLVALAVISVLAALLFGGTERTRRSAQAAACLLNMRTIGTAALTYAGENNNRFINFIGDPAGKNWQYYLAPYVGLTGNEDSASVFRCPGDPSTNPKQPRTYRMNSTWSRLERDPSSTMSGKNMLAVKNPAKKIMVWDVAYSGAVALPLWADNTTIWSRVYDDVHQAGAAPEYPRPHYKNKKVNLLFFDGHAEPVPCPVAEEHCYWDE